MNSALATVIGITFAAKPLARGGALARGLSAAGAMAASTAADEPTVLIKRESVTAPA